LDIQPRPYRLSPARERFLTVKELTSAYPTQAKTGLEWGTQLPFQNKIKNIPLTENSIHRNQQTRPRTRAGTKLGAPFKPLLA
jgi:hypothetical protein